MINIPNLTQAGVVLGMKKLENSRSPADRKEQIYYVGDDVHCLCIGATRSGKSRTIVVQSICALGLAGESLVVSDPKAGATRSQLKRLGVEPNISRLKGTA